MRTAGKAGYSLIEILVALTLFSIAALGLSAGVARALRAGKVSADFTVATVLAQDKLEEFLAQPVSFSDGNDTPRPGFTRAWSVTADTPETGTSAINVTVSWTDPALQTVTLTTVVND